MNTLTIHVAGIGAVSTSRIQRIEAAGNYANVHVRGFRRCPCVGKTLKYFQDRLPYFLRVHQAHLVNPDYIESYHRTKGVYFVVTSDGSVIPVSRRQTLVIKKYLQDGSYPFSQTEGEMVSE